jgi:tRNA (cmo5U34)-methyltransferase
VDNPNFNAIAPIYDKLAGLVFGNALRRAQTVHLSLVPEQARVLLIGGGTGWLLTELLNQKPQTQITYLEASPKMLRLTEQKLQKLPHAAKEQVYLRLGDENSLRPDETFDVIITPFLLDLFPDARLTHLMDRLQTALRPGGLWIFSDFWPTADPPLPWQKLLLDSMYRFFGVVSRVQATKLPDFEKHFGHQPLEVLRVQSFYRGLIQARVYRKV